MRLPPADLLARLGAGESIDSLCRAAGLSRTEFDEWWRRECQSRVPPTKGMKRSAVRDDVRIVRDQVGVPHVFAANDDDLFFGFGYATAQDRLFQLDYLRRRALGRISEVLGPEGIELDLTARIVGLPQIAEREWESLPEETQKLLVAYANGVNALIEDSRDALPIEFSLLDYRPDPWRPQDCLAIAGEFRWYLTGRFPVIVIPELARRVLGEGPLYQAFLRAEADEESILHPGDYPPERRGIQPIGATVGDPSEGTGSNNWVISGTKSASNLPLVASDPHIAFAAVSCWHEVRLTGGRFNVAGTAYAGIPGVMIGRNPHVAWGITNNICSLRDLYQERTDPAHPGCFQFDGHWESARTRVEIIPVRGGEPVSQTVVESRNGPVVNRILPGPARDDGPISLRWLGREPCGWLPAMHDMARAKTCEELRQATKPWLVPTFCVVFGDIFGHIGYQCTGRLPLRTHWERGYRPGWDPEHQWLGVIPFEGMPACTNPTRGWIATANNRVAPEDFPYPLSGTWSSGYRGRRVRQMLEESSRFSRDDFARMQQDSVSLRAIECIPRLIATIEPLLLRADVSLSSDDCRRLRVALDQLAVWDCRMEPDRVAASIFDVFFARWCQRVAEERFAEEKATFVAGAIGGLAGELLERDSAGWFSTVESRQAAVLETFLAGLNFLSAKFGLDPLGWNWGRLHTLDQKHFLSGRGDLGTLLDRGNVPSRGDMVTVCNSGQSPDFTAATGAGYRMVADLSDPQGGLWAIDAGSESGHPGSPHYDDQLGDWLAGGHHYIPLSNDASFFEGTETLTLKSR